MGDVDLGRADDQHDDLRRANDDGSAMIQSDDPSQVETYLLCCSLVNDLIAIKHRLHRPMEAEGWLAQAIITAGEIKLRSAPRAGQQDPDHSS